MTEIERIELMDPIRLSALAVKAMRRELALGWCSEGSEFWALAEASAEFLDACERWLP